MQYLGHIISKQGVAADPSKIEAMMSWPKPSTCKALRGFLGLTDSFQRSPASEEAFQKLKIAMTQAPVLSLLDFSKTFIVECDASGHGVSCNFITGETYCVFQPSTSRKTSSSFYIREGDTCISIGNTEMEAILARQTIHRQD